jgi:integrase/recombinase XerD
MSQKAARPSAAIVREYLDHLRVERGLAPNTLLAYRRDLTRLEGYAEARHRAMLELRQQDLSAFISSLKGPGLSPRSVARVVHGVRGFYRFAVRRSAQG